MCRYICNSVGNQVQIYRTGHRASDLWLFCQNICQFSFKLHELLLKYRSTLKTFYMFKNYLLLEMSIFRRAQQKPSSLGMATSWQCDILRSSNSSILLTAPDKLSILFFSNFNIWKIIFILQFKCCKYKTIYLVLIWRMTLYDSYFY